LDHLIGVRVLRVVRGGIEKLNGLHACLKKKYQYDYLNKRRLSKPSVATGHQGTQHVKNHQIARFPGSTLQTEELTSTSIFTTQFSSLNLFDTCVSIAKRRLIHRPEGRSSDIGRVEHGALVLDLK
jgi:hypothetical protein